MTPAERAIADVLTFRRFWGDTWAFERLDTAAIEMGRELARRRAEECERWIQDMLRCGIIDDATARQLRDGPTPPTPDE